MGSVRYQVLLSVLAQALNSKKKFYPHNVSLHLSGWDSLVTLLSEVESGLVHMVPQLLY